VTGREWFRFGLFVILVGLVVVALGRSVVSIKVELPPAEPAKAAS